MAAKIEIIPMLTETGDRWIELVELSGKMFHLYVSYNMQCAYWELSVMDDKENILVGGIRIVSKIDLLDYYRNFRKGLPAGELKCIAVTPNVKEITHDNFGTDWSLCYVEED